MKKIAGFFYQKPLDLTQKQSFEINLPTDTLYDGNISVLESNRQILCEISKQYACPEENLHSFFVITEICES